MNTLNNYVFHFTGKLNQSYIMEEPYGAPVYKADCAGISLFKDTTFTFINCLTGSEETKKVGKTTTVSFGNGLGFSTNITSGFNIDKISVWDMIADMGYDFTFRLNGLCAHFDIFRDGQFIGYAELGGSGLYKEQYKDSKLGQIPTNGIFKVECAEPDIPGVFLICFALSKTEMALNNR